MGILLAGPDSKILLFGSFLQGWGHGVLKRMARARTGTLFGRGSPEYQKQSKDLFVMLMNIKMQGVDAFVGTFRLIRRYRFPTRAPFAARVHLAGWLCVASVSARIFADTTAHWH